MKIAICVPHYGDVKAKFALSLANMVAATAAAKVNFNGAITAPKLKAFFVGSAVITANRTALVHQARKWGANYILFCDTDMTFPADALLRLLAQNMPAIGCNYPHRTEPATPTAARELEGGEWARVITTEDDAIASKVEQVAFLGLGFCLLNTRIFADLEPPLFQISVGPDGEANETEDGYFFAKLRQAGVPVFLDHSVSWDVGHLFERELTNADTGRGDADSIRPAGGAQ